ncbi:MAG: hypothetical protein IJR28_08165 [Ottowia sp.]|nr:hypothetical protein [Ottowia sp.]
MNDVLHVCIGLFSTIITNTLASDRVGAGVVAAIVAGVKQQNEGKVVSCFDLLSDKSGFVRVHAQVSGLHHDDIILADKIEISFVPNGGGLKIGVRVVNLVFGAKRASPVEKIHTWRFARRKMVYGIVDECLGACFTFASRISAIVILRRRQIQHFSCGHCCCRQYGARGKCCGGEKASYSGHDRLL